MWGSEESYRARRDADEARLRTPLTRDERWTLREYLHLRYEGSVKGSGIAFFVLLLALGGLYLWKREKMILLIFPAIAAVQVGMSLPNRKRLIPMDRGFLTTYRLSMAIVALCAVSVVWSIGILILKSDIYEFEDTMIPSFYLPIAAAVIALVRMHIYQLAMMRTTGRFSAEASNYWRWCRKRCTRKMIAMFVVYIVVYLVFVHLLLTQITNLLFSNNEGEALAGFFAVILGAALWAQVVLGLMAGTALLFNLSTRALEHKSAQVTLSALTEVAEAAGDYVQNADLPGEFAADDISPYDLK